MDIFEDKVSDKIKEQVAIVKSQKGRPRRGNLRREMLNLSQYLQRMTIERPN